jgi:hypothetical protein
MGDTTIQPERDGDRTGPGRVAPRRVMAVAFMAGVSAMAIEMTASRLLAPHFGTSLAVWTNIIGVMMACLSAGYFAGGVIADRAPSARVLTGLILAAGATAGLVPVAAATVLAGLASGVGLPEFAGSLAGTLVLFGPPMLLVGTVTPYAIRLAARDVRTAGALSGTVYAVSTAGSLLGTFLPVLVTLPLLGTRATMFLFSGLLLATAALCAGGSRE